MDAFVTTISLQQIVFDISIYERAEFPRNFQIFLDIFCQISLHNDYFDINFEIAKTFLEYRPGKSILSENPFHSLPVNLKKPVLQALIQEAFCYHVFNSRFDIMQA